MLALLVLCHALWPQPAASSLSGSTTLSPDATFAGPGGAPLPTELEPLVQRYKELIFPHATQVKGAVTAVTISEGGAKDAYTVDIDAAKPVSIQCGGTSACQYALETLSQLTSFNFDDGAYHVAVGSVKDSPRFGHRGLLIDTARHFLPVAAIKKTIRAMSFAKLNVLHIHLTDSQSFPLIFPSHPELAAKAAYSPGERYYPDDIRAIVAYAKEHGLIVVPEIDMPGHTTSWAKSHPEVFPVNKGKTDAAALDPADEATYDLVDSMVAGLVGPNGLFAESPLVHLGSDEVPYAAWNNTKDLAFMKQHGLATLEDLFGYFVARVLKIGEKYGKQVVFWDEAFTTGKVPTSAIVQVWHGSDLGAQAAKAGHKVIMSASNSYKTGWYLDGLGQSWEPMYQLEPTSGGDEASLLGGEGCMWGETVDPSDSEATIWPRLAAIAERLWSPKTTTDLDAARPRLQEFRCLLLDRGVATGIVGGNGRAAPPGPGTCAQGPPKVDTLLV